MSAEGVCTHPEKNICSLQFSPPGNTKGFVEIYKIASFYTVFIQNFTKIAALFNTLGAVYAWRKTAKLHWRDDHESAFQTLKDLMCSALVLANFPAKLGVALHVGALDIAIGVVLAQEHSEHRQFILERNSLLHLPFSLVWLQNLRTDNAKLSRYWPRLKGFIIHIVHRSVEALMRFLKHLFSEPHKKPKNQYNLCYYVFIICLKWIEFVV